MLYFQQLDETDCGAACIAMIASHYKIRKSITSIREIAGTDTKGTNLAGLVLASKKLGFSAHALKGDKSALTTDLPVPFIAHISYQENGYSLQHYVVVKSIKKNTIITWDPNEEKGKKKRSIEDFSKEWTGYAVFLNLEKTIKMEKDNIPLLFDFFSIVKPYKSLIFLAWLASLLLVIFGIISTFYTRYVIDEIIFSQAKFSLATISIGMLVIVILQGILGAIRKILILHFSYKIDLNLVFSYFSHVFHLPMNFFDSRKTGEIISRMQDIGKIRELLSDASITVLMDTFMILIVGPVLYVTNKILFRIILITLPFTALIIFLFSKLYKQQYKKFMINSANVESYLVESINGVSTIKAMNAEDLAISGFEKKQMRMVNTGWKASHLQIYQQLFSEMIKQFGNIVIFWLGSLYIINGELTVGALVSFTALSGYFTEPVQRLVNLQSKLQESYVAANRIGEILKLETEQNIKQKLLYPESFNGSIKIQNLKFRYGTRRYLYEDLNIEIKAGEKIALVGSSGSGKTTIAKLLLKMYVPEDGKISIDNYDLLDIDSYCLRNLIGYVPQDINLFAGTIIENIAFHKPDATFDEIVHAARAAGVEEFIEKYPERYGTMLGEKGTNISGGERQRIALARALLCNPDILILDEATSNLDTVSEKLIKNTIDKLHDGKHTIIIIAHRLSTIMDCDEIFVIDNGKVVQKGKHNELKEQEGLYKQLLEGMTL